MKFLNAVSLSPLAKSEKWTLTEDLILEYSTGVNIVVPKGFVTDLASVPKVFWNVIPPYGAYTQASIVHDFLYQNKGSVCGLQFSRAESDKILYKLMIQAGTNYFVANAMYYAVRAFGNTHW